MSAERPFPPEAGDLYKKGPLGGVLLGTPRASQYRVAVSILLLRDFEKPFYSVS